jgi:hypothetical protein
MRFCTPPVIDSRPQKILAQATDRCFLAEQRKELKG